MARAYVGAQSHRCRRAAGSSAGMRNAMRLATRHARHCRSTARRGVGRLRGIRRGALFRAPAGARGGCQRRAALHLVAAALGAGVRSSDTGIGPLHGRLGTGARSASGSGTRAARRVAQRRRRGRYARRPTAYARAEYMAGVRRTRNTLPQVMIQMDDASRISRAATSSIPSRRYRALR